MFINQSMPGISCYFLQAEILVWSPRKSISGPKNMFSATEYLKIFYSIPNKEALRRTLAYLKGFPSSRQHRSRVVRENCSEDQSIRLHVICCSNLTRRCLLHWLMPSHTSGRLSRMVWNRFSVPRKHRSHHSSKSLTGWKNPIAYYSVLKPCTLVPPVATDVIMSLIEFEQELSDQVSKIQNAPYTRFVQIVWKANASHPILFSVDACGFVSAEISVKSPWDLVVFTMLK